MAKDIGNSLQISMGSSLPTYRAMLATVTPVAACTDILNIALASTATVSMIVTKIAAGMTATAATNLDVFVFRRTTANSGGSPLVLTLASQAFSSGTANLFQMDSNDQLPQAVATGYAAVTTVGTGTIVQADHAIATAPSASTVPEADFVFDSTTRGSKPLIVRPGQSVSLGFNGQTIPGGTVLFSYIEWVEVPTVSLF